MIGHLAMVKNSSWKDKPEAKGPAPPVFKQSFPSAIMASMRGCDLRGRTLHVNPGRVTFTSRKGGSHEKKPGL